MVAHGFAIRLPDISDRRVVHVQITHKGLDVVDAAMADLLAVERRQLEDMDRESQRQLADRLRELLSHFERES